VLRAAVTTVGDAWTTDNEALYAGYQDSTGGGLRRGHFTIVPTGNGDLLILRRMVYCRGVRVDGTILAAGNRFDGRVTVTAGRYSGRLRIGHGRVTGRLGRVRVKATARALRKAVIARAAAPLDPLVPTLRTRRPRP
jgi:hypothetical protein